MKTLAEHNAERMEAYKLRQKLMEPRPNGIACPAIGCGGELWDSNPSVSLGINPDQKGVHCPKCGYRGFALL